ncbi:membrane-bound acyltransferase YfiQ involved in biofilm formation [Peribacillus deserti]|uniref:Membrane-bound acyltransferase YfiQ involved in biofilm formation n=1 Tax=Peribacillus deserti TaxID=673318 RepID=A0ABS2QCL8_9BACI|nr:acyltransferase family protein [Peribacillus deserti]MBM7690837.1 membrane-bound acyltransferase YfiQ involved in biofilm formation [Peribacillus deserti]
MINEWNVLRTVACLSIVFLHSTTMIGSPNIEYFDLFRALLCFATPTFVVLSEIILANRYPDKLPENFWSKRFQWIYLPFLSFAIIDALVAKDLYPNLNLSQKMIENAVFGLFGGYFVLIIFQFYLLHYLVIRFKISMKLLFPLSLIIMFAHLYILNGKHPFVVEYNKMLVMPFTAWFAYFTTAFIIGKHYKKIAAVLLKYRWFTIIPVVLSVALVFYFYQEGNTAVNSRRLDLFPVVISVSMFILAWGQRLPKLRLVNIISNYSFGIYLVHWQVLKYLSPFVSQLFPSKSLKIITLFVITITISIAIIKLVSLLPKGSYIVGNINRRRKKAVSVQRTQAA